MPSGASGQHHIAEQLDELPFAGGTADADRGHSVPDR